MALLQSWTVIVAAHPLACPVCKPVGRVQLRISAEPDVPRGGFYLCPLCSGGAGPGRPPIAVLQPPWRQETPREDVA